MRPSRQIADIFQVGSLVALIGLGAGGDAVAQANRVVSLNLCTDQLVMLLAARDDIASVSALAADRAISAYPDLARGLTVNHGLAEEVLELEPDVIVTSSFGLGSTRFLMRRLGHRVTEVPWANNFDDIRGNIRIVAGAIGAPRRGEELVASFDAGIDRAKKHDGAERPFAALYWANGFTSGAGTLANEVLEAAGFRTVADELGIAGVVQLPMETLIMSAPDVLVISVIRDTPALANEIFRHPALAAAFADKPVAYIPNHLWNCGTPAVVDALERLAEFYILFDPLARPGE